MAPTTRAAALALLILLQLAGPAAATRPAGWADISPPKGAQSFDLHPEIDRDDVGGAEGSDGTEGEGGAEDAEEEQGQEQAEALAGPQSGAAEERAAVEEAAVADDGTEGDNTQSQGEVAEDGGEEKPFERTLKEVQIRAGGMLQKTSASRQQHDSERAPACCCMDKWVDDTTALTATTCNALHDIRPMKKHYWNAAAGKCCWIKKNGLCMPTWVVIFPMGNGGTRQPNMNLCAGTEAQFVDNSLAFAKNVVQLNHQAGQQLINKVKSIAKTGAVVTLAGTCLLDAGGVNIDLGKATGDILKVQKAQKICSRLASASKGPKCSPMDCGGPGGVVAPVQEDEEDDDATASGGR